MKKTYQWTAVFCLIVLLLLANLFLYEKLTRLPPCEAVRQGLLKTVNAQSYRYSSLATSTLMGEEAVISDIQGEKYGKSVHLKGEIPLINSEVEIYKYEDVMYRRDSFTADWLIIPERSYPAVENLIAELNPLAVFDFSGELDVKYAGKEKAGGKVCRVYEIMGREVNKFMELYWQDFRYKLWLDKKSGAIRKSEIVAEHRDNSQYLLKVSVLFWDYNEEFEITPPVDPSAVDPSAD